MNGWTVNDEYTRGYDDAIADLKKASNSNDPTTLPSALGMIWGMRGEISRLNTRVEALKQEADSFKESKRHEYCMKGIKYETN